MVSAANPLASRRRRRDPARRRQRGRRSHRRPARAQARRAAILRPRRRRVPAPFRRARRAIADLRRPRDGAGRGQARPLPRRRRQADALRRGRARAPSIGVPGTVAHARSWRTAATASCPGRACSRRRSRWPKMAFRFRRASTCCSHGWAPTRFCTRRARLLLRCRRASRAESALPVAQSRSSPRRSSVSPTDGADAFYDGRSPKAIVAAAMTAAPMPAGDLTLADLAAYRPHERDRRSACPIAATASAAWGRRRRVARRWPDAGAARAVRSRHAGGARPAMRGRCTHRGGGEARLCRPRPLHRRSGFRRAFRPVFYDRGYLARAGRLIDAASAPPSRRASRYAEATGRGPVGVDATREASARATSRSSMATATPWR